MVRSLASKLLCAVACAASLASLVSAADHPAVTNHPSVTTHPNTHPTHPSTGGNAPPTRPDRDPTYAACDNTTDDNTLDQQGVGLHWLQSDDPNFYLAVGQSACGWNYTDQSNVVCVKPGWIHSGNVDHCNTWVQVFLPESGVSVQGIVWDACGALPETTFGCNDIYLSKQMFMRLAGKTKTESVAAGRLPGHVQWRFIDTPCFACYAGLPGMYPNGTADDCQGLDAQGFLRCGNYTGSNRITGANAGFVCNQNIESCMEANAIATQLPKTQSTAQTIFNDPPGADSPTPTKRNFARDV